MSSNVAAVPGATVDTLEGRIKAQAFAQGFDLCGITRLGPAQSAAAYEQWLAKGYHGEMEYLARNQGCRTDPRTAHPGAVSAIVVGMDYGGKEPSGPVARYARGDDYHDVMRTKLHALRDWLEEHVGHSCHARAYVDTGPILERDLARQAGLGWHGKNTMLISPTLGSFFFIGSLFVNVELAPDDPFDADRCGTCTRCIEACPTGAIVAERELNATRCISYLTIELRGEIPDRYRSSLGEWLYGCDICQDVCPWNVRFASMLREPAFAARDALAGRDARMLAREILGMTQPEFSVAFKGSPMKRAKLQGLKRNAAVVLGNIGSPEN